MSSVETAAVHMLVFRVSGSGNISVGVSAGVSVYVSGCSSEGPTAYDRYVYLSFYFSINFLLCKYRVRIRIYLYTRGV